MVQGKFDYFNSPSMQIAASNPVLQKHHVRSDTVILCLGQPELSLGYRQHAAEVLGFVADQLIASQGERGGLDRNTAQRYVDALARVCLGEISYLHSTQ